jgi:hypothetical protein
MYEGQRQRVIAKEVAEALAPTPNKNDIGGRCPLPHNRSLLSSRDQKDGTINTTSSKSRSKTQRKKRRINTDSHLTYSISFPQPPIGIMLKGSANGDVVVDGFELHSKSRTKPKNLESIHIGDILIGVNGCIFSSDKRFQNSHSKKMQYIGKQEWPLTLRFRESQQMTNALSSPISPNFRNRLISQKSMTTIEKQDAHQRYQSAAIVIQSYVRMVSAQNAVLYALYEQSQMTLEQSFLNMMIHHAQLPALPCNVHRELDQQILKKHNATEHKRTKRALHSAIHFKHQAFEPRVDMDYVIDNFRRCVSEALGMDHYDETAVYHLFMRADTDGDGLISRTEMHTLFDQLDFCLTDAETTALFHWIDFDGDGNVDLDEFVMACMSLLRKRVPIESINESEELLAANAKMSRLTQTFVEKFCEACSSPGSPCDIDTDKHNLSVLQDTARPLLLIGKQMNDIRGEDGWTPMHHVCSSNAGSLEACRFLCENGALVDAEDRYGVRPMMLACREGHLALCQELYRRGADVFGNEILSPMDAARMGNHRQIMQWLKKLGVCLR